MSNTTEKVKMFWNEAFSNIKPTSIFEDSIKCSNNLEKYIEKFSKRSSSILDYGSGITPNLFIANKSNKDLQEIVGIDPSNNAIDFLINSCKLSDIKKIKYLVGDLDLLSTYCDNNFDFIICSNVLDCVEEQISLDTSKELVRILNHDGVILLKVNFYLSEEEALKHNLTCIGHNAYAQNGLFRIAFFNDDYWINRFTSLGMELIIKDSFQRNPSGPKDRIFIFGKK